MGKNTYSDENLFLALHSVEEKNEEDKKFNLALNRLQDNSADDDAKNTMISLSEHGHDKAKLASAIAFIRVANNEEAHWDLRRVESIEDEDFQYIVRHLSTFDDAGTPTRQQEITREVAEFVQEKSALISDNDPDYWWVVCRNADFAAEAFLDGMLITDFEVDTIKSVYDNLLDQPEVWEGLE
jgi:hypothetical protein